MITSGGARLSALIVVIVVSLVGWGSTAMARTFQATRYFQFEDGTVEGQIFARGSKEACDEAAKNPPKIEPPAGRKVAKTWVNVIPTASSWGQE